MQPQCDIYNVLIWLVSHLIAALFLSEPLILKIRLAISASASLRVLVPTRIRYCLLTTFSTLSQLIMEKTGPTINPELSGSPRVPKLGDGEYGVTSLSA